MTRNRTNHQSSISLAADYCTFGKVAYVCRARDLDRIKSMVFHRVVPVVATTGCLDQWTGPAVLAPGLPEKLRSALVARVSELNRPVERARYIKTNARAKPVAMIARVS